LAALQSAFSDAFSDGLAVACKYYDDVQFAAQLCDDFVAEEGKNYAVSVPLGDARDALRRIVSSQPQPPAKARLASALGIASRHDDPDFKAAGQRFDGQQLRDRLSLLRQQIQADNAANDTRISQQLQSDEASAHAAAAVRKRSLEQTLQPLRNELVRVQAECDAENSRASMKLQADEAQARAAAADDITRIKQQLGVDPAFVKKLEDEEASALAARDVKRAQEVNARCKSYLEDCPKQVAATTAERARGLERQLKKLRDDVSALAGAGLQRVAAARGRLEAESGTIKQLADVEAHVQRQLQQLRDDASAAKGRGQQRLIQLDSMTQSLASSLSRVLQLFDRQPAWPMHEALLRFDLPLQRMTTQFLVTKKWKLRFHLLRGSRLWYSDGKKGEADSHEGALAFMRSNPAPDGHYCMDLKGVCARCVATDFAARVCNPHAQAAVSRSAARPLKGRRSRSRLSFHKGIRCISVCMHTLANLTHAPSRLRRTCCLLLPMT